MGLMELKPGAGRAVFLLQTPEENLFPCLFHRLDAACGSVSAVGGFAQYASVRERMAADGVKEPSAQHHVITLCRKVFLKWKDAEICFGFTLEVGMCPLKV